MSSDGGTNPCSCIQCNCVWPGNIENEPGAGVDTFKITLAGIQCCGPIGSWFFTDLLFGGVPIMGRFNLFDLDGTYDLAIDAAALPVCKWIFTDMSGSRLNLDLGLATAICNPPAAIAENITSFSVTPNEVYIDSVVFGTRIDIYLGTGGGGSQCGTSNNVNVNATGTCAFVQGFCPSQTGLSTTGVLAEQGTAVAVNNACPP